MTSSDTRGLGTGDGKADLKKAIERVSQELTDSNLHRSRT